MFDLSDLAKASNNDPVFPIIFSTDFVTWQQVKIKIKLFNIPIFKSLQVGYVFPEGRFPKWAYIDMWAPEIRLVNGNFYVYYTGRKKSGKKSTHYHLSWSFKSTFSCILR